MAKKLTWRIWLLIILVVLSLISIFGIPPGAESGVIVTSVDRNDSSFEQGLRSDMIITEIDGVKIENIDDFTNVFASKFNGVDNVKTEILTKNLDSAIILFTSSPPKITVSNIPQTNILFGLDLAGGSRALVQAENRSLKDTEVADLVDTTNNRLNEFGLTDVRVAAVKDLSGNNFMLVEIAGATPGDLEELISKQGKFEARIGNITVFIGGNRDISSVSQDSQSSGIQQCNQDSTGQFVCSFSFTIFLNEDAAKRHAQITQNLSLDPANPGYLNETLDLFLDDKLVDSLLISSGLQGRVTTQISISGGEAGATQDDAVNNARSEMRRLQTILKTGSLPFKLEIVKLDTISPTLGQNFIRTILIAGLAALVSVSIIISIRYRRIKSSLALVLISFSEVIIILGIASVIEWNLDLPSIAGILATIGTGVDQLIILMDEAQQKTTISLKQKMKRALAIILGSYFTVLVALLPLLWAGAGLLKGFAVTTLIGITIGILVTRPAFADIIKKMEKE